jgi:hypothetical protein
VRRGVTITFTGSADELPWNIREIKPILLSKGALGYGIAETIAIAMEDAWRRIGTYALYADLPVYHAIRSLPTGEHRLLSPAELVLYGSPEVSGHECAFHLQPRFASRHHL